MKKIAVLIFLLSMSISYSFSQGLGIGLGPSFWVGTDVLDWVKSDVPKQNLNALKSNKNPAFNINARVKFGEDNLRYVFNAGWNRFVIDNIRIGDVKNQTNFLDLTLTQNIIPLSFGLQYNIPLSSLKIYFGADAVYSIIRNSVQMNSNILGLSFSSSIATGDKTMNRIGASLGPGTEIGLGPITLDINLKLHFLNLINKETDEKTTSYFMTNVSVFFGNSDEK